MRPMLVAAVSAVTLLSGAAFAQQPHPGGHHARDGFACAIKDGKAAEHLARARAELAVTEAQAPAWETFAARVQQAVQPLGERCERPGGTPERRVALPERLARMEQGQRAMLEATSAIRQAVEGLWPVLTPEQREKSARLMAPRGTRHEGRGGRGLAGDGHPPVPQPAQAR